MRREFVFTAIVLAVIFSFPILLVSCPTRDLEVTKVLHRVPMTELFDVEVRNEWNPPGRTAQAGWLVEDTSTGMWSLAPPESIAGPGLGHNSWNTSHPFYGVRLFSNDRNLPLKEWRNLQNFDGFVFRYRTNIRNTEIRLRDCMFWWAFSDEDYFNEWNWGEDWAADDPRHNNAWDYPNPDLGAEGWREVVVPFHELRRWGIPQNVTLPCNDQTRFNRMIWTHMRFDGRSPVREVPGQAWFWLEIVDFAFFTYE